MLEILGSVGCCEVPGSKATLNEGMSVKVPRWPDQHWWAIIAYSRFTFQCPKFCSLKEIKVFEILKNTLNLNGPLMTVILLRFVMLRDSGLF